MSREVCVHGSPIDNYCPQCGLVYDDQVDEVGQRLRRAEWIRNNAARIFAGHLAVSNLIPFGQIVTDAENIADQLIKRGYL